VGEKSFSDARNFLAEKVRPSIAGAGRHQHQPRQEDESLVGVGLDFADHAFFGLDPGLHEILQRALLPVALKDVIEVERQ
jgi:hypothetical protein